MHPLLLAFIITTAVGGALVIASLLGRLGAIPEPGTWHGALVAADAGVLFGLLSTVFLVVVPFLALLLGGFSLLALHYRGDGRWAQLGLLFATFGATWTVVWGYIVLPALLDGVAVPAGWVGVAIFGAGLASLAVGIAALVLRPAAPT